MKATFRVFAILCSLLLALPLTGLADADFLSITQLREKTPDRWQQTYATPWRTVAIDAEIRTPEVDRFPVLLVGGGLTQPTLTAEAAGWDTLRYDGAYSLILSQAETRYPKSVNGVRLNRNPEAQGSWRAGFAPDNRYVPMSDVTYGEICEQISAQLAQFGYDPADFELTRPERLWAQHMYAYGRKQDMLPGEVLLQCHTKVQGIPVLDHIGTAIEAPTGHEALGVNLRLHACYNAYAGRLTSLFINRAEQRQVLAEDVPLCPPDRVLAAIEAEIEAGHIRKVYEVQLGFALFNEPGRAHNRAADKAQARAELQAALYYAKPMWQVNCLWVDDPRGEIRETASYTDDERNTLDYRRLMVDAQTGRLMCASDDQCDFTGFVAWPDIS